MLCDRKFILYNYYSDFACQVEEMDGIIKEEKLILDERVQQFRGMKKEMQLMKEMIVSKESQLKSMDGDVTEEKMERMSEKME